MLLKGGIPSVSTMSRMLSAIDAELLCLTFMAWVGTYMDTRGRNIAIDGKGLRGGTRKIRGEMTPYMMNAVDTATKLVVGQWPVNEKTNEAGMLPDFLKLLQLEESVVTIDAIGTTGNIMEALHQANAHFILQVKLNCPTLYKDIMEIFDILEKEEKKDKEAFWKDNKEVYSTYDPGPERNRERIEYRKVSEYHDPEGIDMFRGERPYVVSVAKCKQVRIEKMEDTEGNDITPGLKEFLKKGSARQPYPEEGDGIRNAVQCVGLIADQVFSAETMAKIKRDHWIIEGSLHYVLDVTMGEDNCKIKKGREAMSALRKSAYNIMRLLQRKKENVNKMMTEIMDEIIQDPALGLEYIFKPVILN